MKQPKSDPKTKNIADKSKENKKSNKNHIMEDSESSNNEKEDSSLCKNIEYY